MTTTKNYTVSEHIGAGLVRIETVESLNHSRTVVLAVLPRGEGFELIATVDGSTWAESSHTSESAARAKANGLVRELMIEGA